MQLDNIIQDMFDFTKNYMGLKNIDVRLKINKRNVKYYGECHMPSFLSETIHITIYQNRFKKCDDILLELMKTIIHECEHAIQFTEKYFLAYNQKVKRHKRFIELDAESMEEYNAEYVDSFYYYSERYFAKSLCSEMADEIPALFVERVNVKYNKDFIKFLDGIRLKVTNQHLTA